MSRPTQKPTLELLLLAVNLLAKIELDDIVWFYDLLAEELRDGITCLVTETLDT